MRTRDARRTARRATLVVAAAVGLGLLAQGAASAQEDSQGNAAPKVTICHATGSQANPYVQQTVSANAIWNGGTPNGHGAHDGPVFEPGMVEAWGDIIPPFEYQVTRGGESIDAPYPGMNWPEGQAIYEAGCVLPEPVEPDEPADVCPNIEGVQAEVPEGFELVDGACVEVVVEPTDVCPNLEGVQAEAPEGFELVDGACVEVTEVGDEADETDDTDDTDDTERIDEVEVEREVVEREVVEREVEVQREVVERAPVTMVAGVGVDADEVEVRGVADTAAVTAAGQLPVTGPATVPLLVLFGLLNLLFGVRLRRFGRGVVQDA